MYVIRPQGFQSNMKLIQYIILDLRKLLSL